MKERPIIFTGEMVQAILDGHKTQTRRVIKPQPQENSWYGLPGYKHYIKSFDTSEGQQWKFWHTIRDNPESSGNEWKKCPCGQLGDHLWVREAFQIVGYEVINGNRKDNYIYRASYGKSIIKWLSPYFMPRCASRILLEITDVRVERVQDISHEDALSEGVDLWAGDRQLELREQRLSIAQLAFSHLWDSINKKKGYGWDENPFVWIIKFKRIKS